MLFVLESNYNNLFEFVTELDKEKIKVDLQFQHLYFISEEMLNKQKKIDLKSSTSIISDKINFKNINYEVFMDQINKIKALKDLEYIKSINFRPGLNTIKELNNYYNLNGEKIDANEKCSSPFRQIAIKTDGNVIFHSRCFNYEIGNVYNDNLKSIFFGERAEIFRDKLRKNNYCYPVCTRCCGIMGDWNKVY